MANLLFYPGPLSYFSTINQNNEKIMKKFETISQDLWEAKAKEAIEKQPLRKEISLRELQLIHADTLVVSGKPVRMTKQAFKDLCKMVGLPIGFDKTFRHIRRGSTPAVGQ